MRDFKTPRNKKNGGLLGGKKQSAQGGRQSNSSGLQGLSRSSGGNQRIRSNPPPEKRSIPFGSLKERLVTWVFGLGAIWVLAGLGYGGWLVYQAPLKDVYLEGYAYVDPRELLRTAGLSTGMTMNRVDAYEIAKRLADHPRVKSADVRRVYPNKVVVEITERIPELRVGLKGGQIGLVDSDNVLVSLDEKAEYGKNLPIVVGLDLSGEVGMFLHTPALDQTRLLMEVLADAGMPNWHRVVVDVSQPFLFKLKLPDGKRLLVPPHLLEQAGFIYTGLFKRMPELAELPGTLDFSAMTPGGGGRVIIRRDR